MFCPARKNIFFRAIRKKIPLREEKSGKKCNFAGQNQHSALAEGL
jgi:hypothetical protein